MVAMYPYRYHVKITPTIIIGRGGTLCSFKVWLTPITTFWTYAWDGQAVPMMHGCSLNQICIQKLQEHKLLPAKPELISGIEVPLFMIRDSAYPLQSWLMKPFQHSSDLTTQQCTFNY